MAGALKSRRVNLENHQAPHGVMTCLFVTSKSVLPVESMRCALRAETDHWAVDSPIAILDQALTGNKSHPFRRDYTCVKVDGTTFFLWASKGDD